MTPYVGGKLDAIGGEDVLYLDPNVSYYSTDYAVERTFSRQLYTYPAINGETTTTRPDLATAMPVISDGGKKYRITIRSGADWNTTPARQVTAADEVRGVKSTCNPNVPYGGEPDFESAIKGMQGFCNKFALVSPTASSIAHFLENTSLPGVKALNSRTVEFTLTRPTSYFTDELVVPAFSPRPVELDAYAPGSAAEAQHTVSDGPYQITSYTPGKSILLDRNPAWGAAADPNRAAYVDQIEIHEGETNAIEQIAANDPSADVGFDYGPSYTQAKVFQSAHDPRLVTGPTYSSNPYVVFNTVSPTAKGDLRHAAVRRAISYALNRSALIKAMGSASFSSPLTHVLPKGIGGSRNFNDYPHSVAKAKSLLAKAGQPHLTLKFLFPASSLSETELAYAIKSELKKVGIKLKLISASRAGFFGDYLQSPSATHAGRWDLATFGWGPDWYGDAAESFFAPLFDGRTLPPFSSNYGEFHSSTVDSLIDRATGAGPKQADKLWARADRAVMADAAVYPIQDLDNLAFHAAQVHNFVLVPIMQQGDYTNMWLTPDSSS